MKNFELKSMVDFVLARTKVMHEKVAAKVSTAVFEYISEVPNYANFLQQENALWMFVPCDKSGNVLPEPERHEERNSFDEVDYDFDVQELHDYIKAKEKCLFLFENYEIADDVVFLNDKMYMVDLKTGIFHWGNKAYVTVEDLANDFRMKLWLSEAAVKKIGL
ncbi:hypothetical protein [Chryseobacterium gambrini]|uniref:hypothetical protein n=1 Tax=Chryseobacterium gambrini TaxID=373672 RepID=UPI003D1020D4